jgi:alanine dehydrogenase
MSEIAGRMSIQAGAHSLEKAQGGRGTLLSGAPGVPPANVLVLGGGVVGKNAAKIAIGMGANVTIMDKSVAVLRALEDQFGSKLTTLYSNRSCLISQISISDLIIGAVLVPGAAAPKLVTRDDLSLLRSGAVIVDVAIDQGGCFETSAPTTHEHPTFIMDDIVHYCVANMPGAVARTSTLALTNATMPYVINLANKGIKRALTEDPGFLNGLSIAKGNLCSAEVAASQNRSFVSPKKVLATI